MEVIIPPHLSCNGCFEGGMPWLGRIVRGDEGCPQVISHVMIPFCIASKPTEMFRPHSDVRSVDEEPCLRPISGMEPSNHFSVIVQELRRGNIQEEEYCPENSEAGPPVLKGWWARQFPAVPCTVRLEVPRLVAKLSDAPPAVWAKEGEVRIGDEVGCNDLSDCRDLLDCGLDFFSGLSPPESGIVVEQLTNLDLRKSNKFCIHGWVQDD